MGIIVEAKIKLRSASNTHFDMKRPTLQILVKPVHVLVEPSAATPSWQSRPIQSKLCHGRGESVLITAFHTVTFSFICTLRRRPRSHRGSDCQLAESYPRVDSSSFSVAFFRRPFKPLGLSFVHDKQDSSTPTDNLTAHTNNKSIQLPASRKHSGVAT